MEGGGGNWLTRTLADERKRGFILAAAGLVTLAVFALYYVTSFEHKQPLDDLDDFRNKYPLWHSEVSDMEDEDAADLFFNSRPTWQAPAPERDPPTEASAKAAGKTEEEATVTPSEVDKGDNPSAELDQQKSTSFRRRLARTSAA